MNNPAAYKGRFAPSPTGPLHMGSLTTALASYLDAKKNHGDWLLRIEDIDPLREPPEAKADIIRVLESHELLWDETVYTQLDQSHRYELAIKQLLSDQAAYFCPCSRKQLADNNGLHLRNCSRPGRSTPIQKPTTPLAIRVVVEDYSISWLDRITGPETHQLHKETDDFIIKRKEGFYAYHLAVVCDDIAQGITHIVRGADLLDSTPFHLYLYRLFNQPSPIYAHTPVIKSQSGQKLSKQNHAPAINPKTPTANLLQAMCLLNMSPPDNLRSASVKDILDWGVAAWDICRVSH